MKTKLKTFIATILTISTFCAWGQDTTKTEKIKEYYLTLADISPVNISIKYKRQLKNRTFLKIGLVNISVGGNFYNPGNSTSFSTSSSAFSAGLECGLEFRKTVTEKFIFFHGPNLSFTYNARISQIDNPAIPTRQRKSITQAYNGGIPYTLGLLFHINNHILLTAEINPGLFYSYTTRDNRQNPQNNYIRSSAGFSFSNKYGLLSIAYRI